MRFFLFAGWIAILFSCHNHPYSQGEALYTSYCANCHMEDGSGLPGLIPPLAASDYLLAHTRDLPCIIRKGLADTILVNGVAYAQPMAGIPELSEVEIANISNYILFRWVENPNFLTLEFVGQSLETCPE